MPKTSKSESSAANNIKTYSMKDRIDHSVFGPGTIVSINERHTVIAFDETGTRKFVTDMVKLESTDIPAPARRVRKKRPTRKTD